MLLTSTLREPPFRANARWVAAHERACGREVPSYRCALRVSKPFCGIDGPGRAMLEAGWPCESVNMYDKRKHVHAALSLLHGHGCSHHEALTLDKLAHLDDSDGLIGGAPCTDFASLGPKRGLSGPAGSLFILQLERVKELSKRPRPLRWVLLENVIALLHVVNGSVPFHAIQVVLFLLFLL